MNQSYVEKITFVFLCRLRSTSVFTSTMLGSNTCAVCYVYDILSHAGGIRTQRTCDKTCIPVAYGLRTSGHAVYPDDTRLKQCYK
jgi:hypothetical protein